MIGPVMFRVLRSTTTHISLKGWSVVPPQPSGLVGLHFDRSTPFPCSFYPSSV